MTKRRLSFGYWLRRRRKALDLTQAELAARAGCVPTTIKKLDAGARQPSCQLADRLADALALAGEERAMLLEAVGSSSPTQLPPFTAQPSADAAPSPAAEPLSSLPASPGALIGRSRDIAALRSLLTEGETRLLTLTGPDNVGKTRPALQIAIDLYDAFVDGVWLVDLAPLGDPELAPAAIACALSLESGTALLEVLMRALRDQDALLLLDNFEQVVSAAPIVAQLLAAVPHLTILVTSRAPLRLTYEQEYAVRPLELPRERHAHTLDSYAAVQLFVRRARAVQRHFALTSENGAMVEQSLIGEYMDAEGEPHFIMLETIREYALEQLAVSGEEPSIRARHAAYDLSLAEAAVPQLRGLGQLRWLDWLEADDDNLRAACTWYRATDGVEEALRLVGPLYGFWYRRGYLDEGRGFRQRSTALRRSQRRANRFCASPCNRRKTAHSVARVARGVLPPVAQSLSCVPACRYTQVR